MAKQITASVNVARGGVQLFTASGMTRNTTADNFIHTQITVATSETSYTVPLDIGNAMEVGIRNLDSSNFVDVGFATGVYPIRLRPQTNTNTGSVAFFPVALTTNTVFFLANTAACEVEVVILEE